MNERETYMEALDWLRMRKATINNEPFAQEAEKAYDALLDLVAKLSD